jgi:ZIP family zinc transporter
MYSIWYVLGLAALPAVGSFAGGMVAELMGSPKGTLNKSLHAASGIVIAVVAVELMAEAVSKISGWAIGVAFGLGSIAYVGIEAAINKFVESRGKKKDSPRAGMWMIYMAVSMDLFSDGLLVVTGSAVSMSMAIILALGQLLADVPEGYATIANMEAKGIRRSRRTLLSASFAIPVLSAGVIAYYYLLRNQSDLWQMGALAFVAGLLTVAAVEDMITEAHESSKDTRGSILAFSGGFIIFTFRVGGACFLAVKSNEAAFA